jgi:hypothetical protein
MMSAISKAEIAPILSGSDNLSLGLTVVFSLGLPMVSLAPQAPDTGHYFS